MATVNYVGKGLTFPIELDSKGSPVLKTGFELINSSIKIILSWPFLQRIFLSEFGSRLEDLLEEPNDELMKSLVKNFVYEALTKWETRIDILEVDTKRTKPESLEIGIRYRVRATGLENIFTFPFYKEIIY